MIVKDSPQKKQEPKTEEDQDEDDEKNNDLGTIVYHNEQEDNTGTTKINVGEEEEKTQNDFSMYMEVYKQYNQKFHSK